MYLIRYSVLPVLERALFLLNNTKKVFHCFCRRFKLHRPCKCIIFINCAVYRHSGTQNVSNGIIEKLTEINVRTKNETILKSVKLTPAKISDAI